MSDSIPSEQPSMCGKFYTLFINDLASYINEYLVFICGNKIMSSNLYLVMSRDTSTEADSYEDFRKTIIETNVAASNTVVVYAKHGCAFCKAALDALDYAKESDSGNNTNKSFDVQVVYGAATNSKFKAALGNLLNLFDVTFPQIVINGTYVGGSDQIVNIVYNSNNEFSSLLSAPNPLATLSSETVHQLPWKAALKAEAENPNLFMVPHIREAGWPKWRWYSFHWAMHANLVRYISILQVLLLIPPLIIYSAEPSLDWLANIFLFVVLVDACLFVLWGPSPWSPTGALSTYLLWKSRGPATSTLPYKAVWVSYIVALAEALRQSDSSQHRVTIIGIITNAVILVAFRF